MGNWIPKEILENEEDHDEKDTSTNSKVVVADCDPRSPTNGIVRTPICFFDKVNDKNVQKNAFFDPRSPTTAYNRTPINIKEYHATDSISNNSFDMSGADASDSSFLLQQVPEEPNDQSNSPDKYTISSKSLSNFTSNLPRHILQRKQVEKINRKKYDKENLN